MKKCVSIILKVLVFLAIGILLFWLAYRGQDFGKILEVVSQAKWLWIVIASLLSVIGHYSRAMRWRLLLEPSGYNPRNINLFISVMMMYMANMAIPRSGEVVRCGIVTKYEKIPFAICLGSVVTERIADVLVVLILSVVVFVTQLNVISGVMEQNPSIEENLIALKSYLPLIILISAIVLLIVFYVFRYISKYDWKGYKTKFISTWNKFKEGLLTIFKLKKRGAFVFHSLFINFIYFYTTYLLFKAFPFTENLSLMVALVIFVLSTFGVIIPSPGGIGTWHFIVIELLSFYGVNREPEAGAYALVTHGVQDMLFVIVGFAAMLLIPIINAKYQPHIPDEIKSIV